MDQFGPAGRAKARGLHALCGSLREQIQGGVYRPGATLPSTRSLASELGASRTTITAAYEQLAAEGYIETHQGRRARVALDLPTVRLGGATHKPETAPRLSTVARRLMKFVAPPVAVDSQSTSFRYGDIAASDFPCATWRRALTSELMRLRSGSLRYADPQGLPELRAALQAYLWRARGIRSTADQIIVVNGSQQGLDLCARILLDPGDRFVIENPCYWAAKQAFESIGATARLVPVDDHGLQTAHLNRIESAKLCYVTPSHQFPLGHVLSAPRREQLLRWAAATGAYVIEDDYDSEFRYDIQPIRPLHAFDHAVHVVYLGTLSKSLSPVLRLGYLIVPQPLVPVFRTAKRLMDRHTPTLEQAALARLLTSGAYESHVRKLRRKNARRRLALLSALDKHFAGNVEVQGSDAGLHVVVWFNGVKADAEADIVAHAAGSGVAIYPISGLYADRSANASTRRAGFVFGYAALEEADIEAGIKRLAGVIGPRQSPRRAAG